MDQVGGCGRIVVRDDGSTDGTRALLTAWTARFPDRFTVLPDDGRRLGACGNFAELLAASTARRVMFCDQDDRWHQEKIAASWAAMDRLEAVHGADRPLLVHGDVHLVDARLQPLGSTLSQSIRVRLDAVGELHRQLVQNAATGCTMMLNRPLIDACVPLPQESIMHDWWVALVASAIGSVAVLPEPLLDYRQHQANVIGAQGMRLGRLVQRFGSRGAVAQRFARAAAQAEALLVRHAGAMSVKQRRVCAAFAALPKQGWWGRRVVVVRHGFWMSGWMRNLGMLVLL
jgi:glycosyltransferase involved in cell wall biosynthesis